MNNIVYLNGEFIPLEKAYVSVTDRGFLFGDGVYELIPIYNGRLFCVNEHLDRLERSLKAIALENPLTRNKWHATFKELMECNHVGHSNQKIYLQITRGPAQERTHAFPNTTQPTVYLNCTPLKTPSLEQLRKGETAITVTDIRWENCFIKSINLLPNVLATQQAKLANRREAILIRNGLATECASSNLFIVKDQMIKTPPLSHYILGGITRDLIIELMKQHHIAYQETNVTESELRQANEIWITSSSKEILPIVKLDDQLINNGQAGPCWEKMITLYMDYKKTYHY